MNIGEKRIQELAEKWLKGTITNSERAEFMEWYDNADDGRPLQVSPEQGQDEVMHGMKIFKKIHDTTGAMENDRPATVHRIHFLRRSWFRYAAAVIILSGILTYLYTSQSQKDEPIVVTLTPKNAVDVKPPASTHAVITLGDGRVIVLDSVGQGQITTQGNVHISKLADGQIIYKGLDKEVVYNTLSNPRGSKVIQVTLSDGTKVWLNTESSLKYPTSFTGSSRVVEVSGETYFEVTKNADKPFIVKKDGMEVKVLGTHFNVNAYDDEDKIKVTLLEGSVNVIVDSAKSLRLSPGEQSNLTKNGELTKIRGVDVAGVMAWKNGRFDFGAKSDIATIMRQLARWYNVQVEYRGDVEGHFGGSISRYVNLSQVLKAVEATGTVKFEVEGTRVVVKP